MRCLVTHQLLAPLIGHADTAWPLRAWQCVKGSAEPLRDVFLKSLITLMIPAWISEIWRLAYSPDDLLLASTSADGTVRLWED